MRTHLRHRLGGEVHCVEPPVDEDRALPVVVVVGSFELETRLTVVVRPPDCSLVEVQPSVLPMGKTPVGWHEIGIIITVGFWHIPAVGDKVDDRIQAPKCPRSRRTCWRGIIRTGSFVAALEPFVPWFDSCGGRRGVVAGAVLLHEELVGHHLLAVFAPEVHR